MRRLQRIMLLLMPLLALPSALAYRANTGISPLNSVIETVSKLFNVTALENPTVQLGFLKFSLFVMFLAVTHFAFSKVFDNKTAGVLATMFSLIGAFLMPVNWVSANGAVITAVLSGLIPLGLVGAGIWFALYKLNNNNLERFFALLIILILFIVLDVYQNVLGLPLLLFLPERLFRGGKR